MEPGQSDWICWHLALAWGRTSGLPKLAANLPFRRRVLALGCAGHSSHGVTMWRHQRVSEGREAVGGRGQGSPSGDLLFDELIH